MPEIDPESVPNRDIEVSEKFLQEQAELLDATIRGLATAAWGIPGAVDRDVREALDALARTYRTLQSGLYYESKPANLLAARICELMKVGVPSEDGLAVGQQSAPPARLHGVSAPACRDGPGGRRRRRRVVAGSAVDVPSEEH
jgi:hypothetical protein